MKHLGDVTKLHGCVMAPVDVAVGGSPCQDLSVANRNRLGLAGERSGLYMEQIRVTKELRYTESGKKLMRHTKAEMISRIGQCFGIVISFLDLRQSYDYLKATFDILRDENTSILKIIREVDTAYEKANEANFYEWYDVCKQFDRLLDSLPARAWLE